MGDMEVGIRWAKMHFSRLLERVEQGEEITIMRSNVPVAKLIAFAPSPARCELGWARGEFTVPDNFDDSLPPDVEDSFYQ